MTIAIERRSAYQTVVGDLLDLLVSQPQQVLLSTGSVTIVAAEAALLVPLPANIAVAVGAEWAYLRGIASSGKGDARWVTALNWGALVLVVLYGMLWGGRKFGALAETLTPGAAWLLTAVHIIPLAFVSLAAAMVHRSAVAVEQAEAAIQLTAEQERQRRMQEQRDDLALEAERKEQEIALWMKGQHAKALVQAQIGAQSAVQGSTETTAAFRCPGCGAELTQGQYGAAKRYGRCRACRPSRPDAV